MLSLAFFGSGDAFSLPVLHAVAERHRVVAVVRAGRASLRHWLGGAARSLGLRARDPLVEFARSHRIPCWEGHPKDHALAGRLAALAPAPDLLCVAGYSWLLPREVYTIPRLGAINLHSSLLPRHRGPAPQFWIYHQDDRETGVTVHYLDDGADTGDILAQDAFPLPRGLPVSELRSQCARRGAALVVDTLQAIVERRARAWRQDDAQATVAPRVRQGTAMVDHDAWDVERVWHFLTGLCPHWREPLYDERGRLVRYRRVIGYERRGHDARVGVVRRDHKHFLLFSRGGIVRLA
jgi:methionyl-tRNA formyltransferase